MKSILFSLFMLVTSCGLLLTSCSSDSKKEDPSPATPAITAPVGKIDFKISGTAFEVPGGAQITNNQIILGGSVNLKGVSIIIAKSATTGTYDVQGTAFGVEPGVDVSYTNGSSDAYSSIFATNGKSVGTVTISEIDQTNKTISGTFTSTVVSVDGVTSISLTEGSFNKIPYVTQAASSLTAKINGTAFTAVTIAAESQDGYIGINGQTIGGTQVVTLTINSDIKAGTYDIGDITGPISATYTSFSTSAIDLFLSTQGKLTITKHDTSLKRIEGSFSFESASVDASSLDNPPAAPSITAGTFAITYF